MEEELRQAERALSVEEVPDMGEDEDDAQIQREINGLISDGEDGDDGEESDRELPPLQSHSATRPTGLGRVGQSLREHVMGNSNRKGKGVMR